jgi:hypothetical protein
MEIVGAASNTGMRTFGTLVGILDDKLLGEDGVNTVDGEVVGLVGGGGDDEGRRE